METVKLVPFTLSASPLLVEVALLGNEPTPAEIATVRARQLGS